MHRFRHALLLTLALGTLLPGCERETRVVRWDPMLGNLPNAQTGAPYVRDTSTFIDPTKVPEDKLVLEDARGHKTLVARTGRHLMTHIYNCIANDERDLFTEQVLSELTKTEYYQRGMDPRQAFDTLKERWEDIVALFDSIPGGEFTPGVYKKPMGMGVQRIELTGPAAAGLQWTGFDMVMEKGNYRLRWFVVPQPRKR